VAEEDVTAVVVADLLAVIENLHQKDVIFNIRMLRVS